MKKIPWSLDLIAVTTIGLSVGFFLGTREFESNKVQPKPVRESVSTGELNYTLNTWLLKNPKEIVGTDIAALGLVAGAGISDSKNVNLETLEKRLNLLSIQVKENTKLYSSNKIKSSQQWHTLSSKICILADTIREEYTRHDNEVALKPNLREFDKGVTRPDEFLPKGSLDWENKPSYNNPVLLVSLARRMGYPMKLMTNRGYYMSCWEGSKKEENFYFEVADGRYATFTRVKEEDMSFYIGLPPNTEKFEFQKLANPREEFAYFLYMRGITLEERGYKEDARVAYAAAQVFDPKSEVYSQALLSSIDKQLKHYQLSREVIEKVNAEYFRLKKPDPVKPPELNL